MHKNAKMSKRGTVEVKKNYVYTPNPSQIAYIDPTYTVGSSVEH